MRLAITDEVLVYEEQRFPQGYGLAWRDELRRCSVCYPIPINLMVRLAREIRYWTMKPKTAEWEYELERAYRQGRQDGKSAGWREAQVSFFRELKRPLDN